MQVTSILNIPDEESAARAEMPLISLLSPQSQTSHKQQQQQQLLRHQLPFQVTPDSFGNSTLSQLLPGGNASRRSGAAQSTRQQQMKLLSMSQALPLRASEASVSQRFGLPIGSAQEPDTPQAAGGPSHRSSLHHSQRKSLLDLQKEMFSPKKAYLQTKDLNLNLRKNKHLSLDQDSAHSPTRAPEQPGGQDAQLQQQRSPQLSPQMSPSAVLKPMMIYSPLVRDKVLMRPINYHSGELHLSHDRLAVRRNWKQAKDFGHLQIHTKPSKPAKRREEPARAQRQQTRTGSQENSEKLPDDSADVQSRTLESQSRTKNNSFFVNDSFLSRMRHRSQQSAQKQPQLSQSSAQLQPPLQSGAPAAETTGGGPNSPQLPKVRSPKSPRKGGVSQFSRAGQQAHDSNVALAESLALMRRAVKSSLPNLPRHQEEFARRRVFSQKAAETTSLGARHQSLERAGHRAGHRTDTHARASNSVDLDRSIDLTKLKKQLQEAHRKYHIRTTPNSSSAKTSVRYLLENSLSTPLHSTDHRNFTPISNMVYRPEAKKVSIDFSQGLQHYIHEAKQLRASLPKKKSLTPKYGDLDRRRSRPQRVMASSIFEHWKLRRAVNIGAQKKRR